MNIKIAVLPGDGIGPEIIAQALEVTKAVCNKFGHTKAVLWALAR